MFDIATLLCSKWCWAMRYHNNITTLLLNAIHISTNSFGNYKAKPARQKLDILWGRVVDMAYQGKLPSGNPSFLKLLQLFSPRYLVKSFQTLNPLLYKPHAHLCQGNCMSINMFYCQV